jgi:glycerate-2-kinase
MTGMTEKDLVIVVICGGGSAMFEAPHTVTLETLTGISKALLASGATISDMNIIRKHLSRVKGGGLARHLFPAKIVSLMFSDVPGNDMSVIASGPTVKDTTTMDDVKNTLEKFGIKSGENGLSFSDADFADTVTDEKYFTNVFNVIVVSNMTALKAMEKKAAELGYKPRIYSDHFQSDAKVAGEKLLQEAKDGEILLVGGETTVKVRGHGKGGRNQTLVLAALPFVTQDSIICSFDSDGADMYYFAGAIGDRITVDTAKNLGLDEKAYLDDDNSYEFFEKVGDGIYTDKLESNVSDLMIVFKE